MATLYAWAIPANLIGSLADHTWVTTFDTTGAPYADLHAVAASGESLWMCWGSFHPRGGTPRVPSGLLGSAAGSIERARCLVEANADSVRVPAARGTIQVYGVEGVCHQVANQVLLATGGATAPMTVKGSRGYIQSVFVYGQYGLARAAWRRRVEECGGPVQQVPAGDPADDFEERARHVLRDRDDLVAQLVALRSAHQDRLLKQRGRHDLTAEEINRQNRELMARAAAILDPEDFDAIFDVDGGGRVDLVDPDVLAASRRDRPLG